MKIFRKLKTGTKISLFSTNMLYDIQICKQNENAWKKKTHQQSTESLVNNQNGKNAHLSPIFERLILMLCYVIIIEVIYCLSLTI